MKPSKRLENLGNYYFAVKREEIRKLEAEGGEKFISLAIGNPDLSPPDEVIDELKRALNDPNAHAYQSYGGLPELKETIADFYLKKFGTKIDPEKNILPLMGSKSGILYLHLAFLNPGDKVLIPEPGYMAYKGAAYLVGAIPQTFELDEYNHWQPDWNTVESQLDEKTKILWLNYVNMPTGVIATENDLKKAVAFVRQNRMILAFDNPYSLITTQPASVLKYAEDVPVVEFQSFSKNFNMAGWRIGWVAGHEDIISQIAKVQNNVESGMFYAIQKAAVKALQLSDEWMNHLNEIYSKRRKKAKEFAKKFGGTCEENTGGMFCWVKLPEGMNAQDFTDELFYKHRIFISPGTIFGEKWNQYVRISLTVSEAQYDEAIQRLQTWKK